MAPRRAARATRPGTGCATRWRSGFRRSRPTSAALVAPEPPAETPPKDAAEISAAEEARDRLIVQVVQNSRVLQIRFTSEDPQLARDVANMVADLYIADQLEAKFNAVRRANDYLGGQVREAPAGAATDRAADRRAAGLVRHPARRRRQGGSPTESLTQLNTDLIEARNQQADRRGEAGRRARRRRRRHHRARRLQPRRSSAPPSTSRGRTCSAFRPTSATATRMSPRRAPG